MDLSWSLAFAPWSMKPGGLLVPTSHAGPWLQAKPSPLRTRRTQSQAAQQKGTKPGLELLLLI